MFIVVIFLFYLLIILLINCCYHCIFQISFFMHSNCPDNKWKIKHFSYIGFTFSTVCIICVRSVKRFIQMHVSSREVSGLRLKLLQNDAKEERTAVKIHSEVIVKEQNEISFQSHPFTKMSNDKITFFTGLQPEPGQHPLACFNKVRNCRQVLWFCLLDLFYGFSAKFLWCHNSIVIVIVKKKSVPAAEQIKLITSCAAGKSHKQVEKMCDEQVGSLSEVGQSLTVLK